ncbi:pimeloyl-ACP methyl ester carboxylesterase [Kineococcus xinjiangensis]|uniref:Pimeloyl-ACP methyl ester carboxylesterase n=1 Tax=Kineococcus xinjiangensis TaxID=512762 RepID=A0A2S6IJ96_9ACTN|nr:alpha/beta fold hydrolase [Kineococcus xinjiangensis]PPK94268.1 pimeloyl-ACP methyl ester carboxylesterase [Kineococcus xinjiangensis]
MLTSFTRDGLVFDVRDSGPGAADAAVVCLHGFPQDAGAYDAVVPLLAAEGLRVLVPDQRGYSPGARPAGRRPYVLRELVADVLALLDTAGLERAHVVGHDWGGAVAWALAGRHPQRVASLTALSTPHPEAMRAALPRGQALRSAYMGFFQLPRVPEALLLARDGARLRQGLRSSGLPEPLAQRYARRMLEPGALTAALAWYRALPVQGAGRARPAGGSDGRGFVPVPVTYLSGRRDPFFAPAAVRGTGNHVTGRFTHRELDCGHWLPEKRPEQVARAVLEQVADAG